LLSRSGYILTQYEAVKEARKAMVVFADHQAQARVVRVDRERGVALLLLFKAPGKKPVLLRNAPPPAGEMLRVVSTPTTDRSHYALHPTRLAGEKALDGQSFYPVNARPPSGNLAGAVVDEYGLLVGLAARGDDVKRVIPLASALKALGVRAR